LLVPAGWSWTELIAVPFGVAEAAKVGVGKVGLRSKSFGTLAVDVAVVVDTEPVGWPPAAQAADIAHSARQPGRWRGNGLQSWSDPDLVEAELLQHPEIIAAGPMLGHQSLSNAKEM
jgi:hypothetical protein